MNRRETILGVVIIGGLLVTVFSLSGPRSFDCRQPLLSSVSSCSAVGGPCINVVNKAGFTGLMDFLDIGYFEPFEISCMPGCTVRIGRPSHSNESDSVSRATKNVP